jgi:hypothetical protein
MAPKFLKPHKIIVLCIIAALLVVPAVSARKETDGSGKKANNGVTPTNYIIIPAQNIDQSMHLDSTQTIVQGQTIPHNVNVGYGVKYLEVDLNWGPTSNSLTLTPLTPSLSSLGTYYDNYDRITGRIHAYIYPKGSVYVDSGPWKFQVCGEKVSKTQSYTLSVYGH